MSEMNIATALNKKYLLYTIVMLTSLCENNPVHIDAYILNTELDDTDFDRMRKALSEYDIRCIDAKVDAAWFDARCPHTEEWSMEAYYRLMLPELLPAEVERLLYLDVDVIVHQNLSEMYGRDLEGMDLWACENCNGTTTPELMMAKQSEMFAPFMEQGFRYFNSGVLLINLRQLREKDIMTTYLQAMAEWDYAMDCPDQDILNWVHRDSVGYLPWRKYDLFARHAHQLGITYEDVRRDTAIVHFYGAKPWNAGKLHFDIEKLWWDYAGKTPYYQELLEEFLQCVLTDPSVERQIREMADANNRLTEISRTLAEKVKQADNSGPLPVTEEEQISRAWLAHLSPDPLSSAVIPSAEMRSTESDLSVIIPCYNVEKYVSACVESVLSQPMQHRIEIILVNDGSTDRTGEILKQYASRKNVVVIEQENRGLSGARNRGLQAARGRYLLFLDSDDLLAENSLDALLSQAMALDVDILEAGMLQIVDGQILPLSEVSDMNGVRRTDPFRFSGYACGKLIRSALFERVKFPEGYLFEDSIMVWLIYPRCERAAISSDPLYIYRRNQEGITASSKDGNPKTVDTWWITEQMLRDLESLHLRISPALYDTVLSQIALNYIRTASLGDETKVAVFHLTDAWFLRHFAGFTTDREDLQIVEKALRLKGFGLYEQACTAAWRSILSKM